LLVGNRRLLAEQGIVPNDVAQTALERLEAAGQTVLLLARDHQLVGLLGVQDVLRADAPAVLNQLAALGIARFALVTGDRESAARAMTRDLPLHERHAELLPEDKAVLVARWREQGHRVAMVGDGINDAPALALADVGLALTSVDLAAEAGDVLLMGEPLSSLPFLVRLSRQTVHVIRQNILWFAFGVNLVGIALTAWLWPLITPSTWFEQSPVAAVIYHQLGSLLVLLNSLRLLWFERVSTSPTAQRWSQRMISFDAWLGQSFDAHEWLHWLITHWRRVAFGVTATACLAWLATGFTIIPPHEVAVVRRFGRPVAELTPGWTWRWPAPIEDITRISQQVRTVTLGFRESADGAGNLTWVATHRAEGTLAEEALAITGDRQLVDLQAVARYKIADPRRALFDVAGWEDLLRAEFEAVVRSALAGRPFVEVLTTGRDALQREIVIKLGTRLNPHATGLELEGVSLLDVHPPADVVDAYYGVARAMERRQQALNRAHETANTTVKDAESVSFALITEAHAHKVETIQRAMTDAERFLAWHRARHSLDVAQEKHLKQLATDAAQRGDPPDKIQRDVAARRKELLTIHASLTDFRIFWDALSNSLAGRPLVLIDADKIKGQRNLMLIEPELLRPPMLMPPDRRVPTPKEKHDDP
jgi:Cu+-exporting ATPase